MGMYKILGDLPYGRPSAAPMPKITDIPRFGRGASGSPPPPPGGGDDADPFKFWAANRGDLNAGIKMIDEGFTGAPTYGHMWTVNPMEIRGLGQGMSGSSYGPAGMSETDFTQLPYGNDFQRMQESWNNLVNKPE